MSSTVLASSVSKTLGSFPDLKGLKIGRRGTMRVNDIPSSPYSVGHTQKLFHFYPGSASNRVASDGPVLVPNILGQSHNIPGSATMENSTDFPQKIKNIITIWSINPPLGAYPKEMAIGP